MARCSTGSCFQLSNYIPLHYSSQISGSRYLNECTRPVENGIIGDTGYRSSTHSWPCKSAPNSQPPRAHIRESNAKILLHTDIVLGTLSSLMRTEMSLHAEMQESLKGNFKHPSPTSKSPRWPNPTLIVEIL